MKEQDLIRRQLDQKISKFKSLEDVVIPPSGWVYSIRKALNMSLRQLGKRIGITGQSVKEIETRERHASVSIAVLTQVAAALNMKFVYGFVPEKHSLEKMLEAQTYEIAKKIVERTVVTMDLEAQKTSDESIRRAIKEKAEEIKNKMPRYLWD